VKRKYVAIIDIAFPYVPLFVSPLLPLRGGMGKYGRIREGSIDWSLVYLLYTQ